MAVVHTKSTTVTNLDASPVSLANPHLSGGRVRAITESITATSGYSANSTYRVGRVHSSWLFLGMAVEYAALGSGAKVDIGFYEINGGAVKVKDCLVDNLDVASAGETGLKVTTADGTAGASKYLWELAGETSDPNTYWDLTVHVAVAIAGTGALQVTLLYTDGS